MRKEEEIREVMMSSDEASRPSLPLPSHPRAPGCLWVSVWHGPAEGCSGPDWKALNHCRLWRRWPRLGCSFTSLLFPALFTERGGLRARDSTLARSSSGRGPPLSCALSLFSHPCDRRQGVRGAPAAILFLLTNSDPEHTAAGARIATSRDNTTVRCARLRW